MKTAIIIHSYHHGNTEKIAKAIALVLNASIVHAQDCEPGRLKEYEMIGFGSGIDSGKNYAPILELASKLPKRESGRAFLFSTSGVTNDSKMKKDHKALRETLQKRGYIVLNEFQCKGFNTNSVLKYFGGMNKEHPNLDDLEAAKKFALAIDNRKQN